MNHIRSLQFAVILAAAIVPTQLALAEKKEVADSAGPHFMCYKAELVNPQGNNTKFPTYLSIPSSECRVQFDIVAPQAKAKEAEEAKWTATLYYGHSSEIPLTLQKNHLGRIQLIQTQTINDTETEKIPAEATNIRRFPDNKTITYGNLLDSAHGIRLAKKHRVCLEFLKDYVKIYENDKLLMEQQVPEGWRGANLIFSKRNGSLECTNIHYFTRVRKPVDNDRLIASMTLFNKAIRDRDIQKAKVALDVIDKAWKGNKTADYYLRSHMKTYYCAKHLLSPEGLVLTNEKTFNYLKFHKCGFVSKDNRIDAKPVLNPRVSHLDIEGNKLLYTGNLHVDTIYDSCVISGQIARDVSIDKSCIIFYFFESRDTPFQVIRVYPSHVELIEAFSNFDNTTIKIIDKHNIPRKQRLTRFRLTWDKKQVRFYWGDNSAPLLTAKRLSKNCRILTLRHEHFAKDKWPSFENLVIKPSKP